MDIKSMPIDPVVNLAWLSPRDKAMLHHTMTCQELPGYGGANRYPVYTDSYPVTKRIAGSLACLLARLVDPPDAVGFTAFSAVPLADAFRGYYEEIGAKPPELFAIPSYSLQRPRELTQTIGGMTLGPLSGLRVAVVDQFVASGTTVVNALKLVKGAGADVTTLCSLYTQWYHEGYDSDDKTTWPDIKRMTSPYADLMRKIGRACAPVVDECGDQLREASASVDSLSVLDVNAGMVGR